MPKRVPAPERSARYDDQVKRLPGLNMTTSLEPSHQLLDKASEHQPATRIPVACDYALRQTLRRRALAYDQTGLAGYKAMEDWTARLYFAMDTDPPPSYNHVSKSQIITADREMRTRTIEKCRSGVLPFQSGTAIARPIEVAVKKLINDPTVLTFLAHLP